MKILALLLISLFILSCQPSDYEQLKKENVELQALAEEQRQIAEMNAAEAARQNAIAMMQSAQIQEQLDSLSEELARCKGGK